MKYIGWIFAAVLALIVAVVVARAGHIGPAQGYRPSMFEVGASVATALLVIALFVERSIAVVYSLIWGDAQRQAILELRRATDSQVAAAEDKLAEVLSFKERVRLLIGLVAALFISLAGVRTLDGLLQIKNPTSIFYMVDVLLTAGLIAGGSNGLAWLIQMLKARITPDKPTNPEELQALLTTTT